MAQNTNFKVNKYNNQKRKLPYIKVRIDKLVDVDDCNTKAFASVTIGGAVAIHGIRVMDSHKGLFVTMPSNNFVDKNGEKQYSEIAHPTSKEARKAIVTELWERTIRRLMNSRARLNPRMRIRKKQNILFKVCK